jgi:hypothetical protein
MISYRDILVAVCTGIGATLLTDIWNKLLKWILNIQSLNFCLLGRWIMYMPYGIFRHQHIRTTPPKSYECLMGWLAHYSIGIGLAVFFMLLVSVAWLNQPTLLPALVYGIGTVVFPLFILQPALGLGPASSKVSNPAQARMKSVMTHIVFGVGIWLSALVLKYAFPEMG